ncbi:all trans-polyprenyl-diphosphate synthase PDSS2-like [Diadema antillarum]|uniref:all trans-polyprenyl-diphosphate synthase PDSS2-like n=1 Tax=Diadema antillarum TaxID=105358 RepID=UPI003A8C13CF
MSLHRLHIRCIRRQLSLTSSSWNTLNPTRLCVLGHVRTVTTTAGCTQVQHGRLGNHTHLLQSDDLLYGGQSRGFMNLFGPSEPSDWAKAITEAEKVVGYSTSFMSLRCLLSDELANVALHMRKLVGTRHPLLKTAKSFLTDGKHSLQTRGLIILLVSKAASTTSHNVAEDGKVSVAGGISSSQRALAEISEMIHTAFLVHRGVVNLLNLDPSMGPLKVMELGNKMAVLSGDFLLASACKALAGLRNTVVVELISKAIADLTEAAFTKFSGSDLNPVITLQPDLTFTEWERYVYLSSGTLIGHSCMSALKLSNQSPSLTDSAFDFGRNIAWAQQLHTDMLPFTTASASKGHKEVNLMSAPVILYLQTSHGKGHMSEVNYSSHRPDMRKLVHAVCSSPALDDAKQRCHGYADSALEALGVFPSSEARTALEKMVHAVRC